MKKFVLIALGFILHLPIYGEDFDWWLKLQQIKPLESNQTAIENLFGRPYHTAKSSSFYEFGKNRLIVEYSDGVCDEYKKKDGQWDAPAGTVVGYTFSFTYDDPPILDKFAEFAKINLKKFTVDTYKNLNDVDTPSEIPYNFNNEKSGISLQGFKRGYEDKEGNLKAGKLIFLHTISIDAPENTAYPKCK